MDSIQHLPTQSVVWELFRSIGYRAPEWIYRIKICIFTSKSAFSQVPQFKVSGRASLGLGQGEREKLGASTIP